MKKIAFLSLVLFSSLAYSQEYSGVLVENMITFQQYCSETYNVHDQCSAPSEYMLAGVLVSETEAVNVLIKKSDFPSIEGKKVRAKFDQPNPIGTVVEVLL